MSVNPPQNEWVEFFNRLLKGCVLPARTLKEFTFLPRSLHVRLDTGQFDFEGDKNGGGSRSSPQFSTERSAVPEDLRTWISEPELAHLVENAVQQISGAERAVDRTRAWDVLLGMITYFYATGQYASDEIEDSLNRYASLDHVPSLVFGYAPASTVFRRFRRTNRAAIEQCLAKVIRSACEYSKEPSVVSTDRSGSENESLDFQHEANARLAHAIQLDSWALDV